ncbi:MAG: CPBP family glutamic-type intramembrane protease [Promethearchaeota archaeon]|jgi:membrane protease YdiL (CAAX protease family)
MMPEIVESDNRNLYLFFIITFGFSWLLWLPNLLSSYGIITHLKIFPALTYLGSFGPTLTALLLTFYNDDIEGVKLLLRKGWQHRNTFYLLISLILIPAIFGLSFLLTILTERKLPPGLEIWSQMIFIPIYFIFSLLTTGPFQEEFGWRGYALERLQSQFNALKSSIILGGIWALWHLPLFFISGTPQENQNIFAFFTTVILLSVLYTWLYNNTEGSVLVAMIFHTTYNISSLYYPINNTMFGNMYNAILLIIIVILVIQIYGQEELIRI